PPQLLYLLGGRETLLGHTFRGYVGDAFWLLRGEASRTLLDPWVSLRAFASAGRASMDSDELPAGWAGLDPDGGVLLSVGAGVGLLWDVLRIDVGRGLDGGRWEAAFSVTRRFRSWL
ncbi:MAG TPA: hypothetical protein VE173_02535, partial [Longimicrobiales bacterium]|nr:hypothetical protein [Longimicrobiales bacterium]